MSYSLSPPPTNTFPVPNKPPQFCGCKATCLLTHFTTEDAQPYVDIKQLTYFTTEDAQPYVDIKQLTYFTTEDAQPYVDIKQHAYLLTLPQKKLNPMWT